MLSRLDSCDEANAQAVQDTFTSQITSIARELKLSATPQVISVSAQRYLKGKSEGKNLLLKLSHIEELKAMIAKAKQELHNPAHRLNVLEERKSQLINLIDENIKMLRLKNSKVLEAKKALQKRITEELEQANKSLANMY